MLLKKRNLKFTANLREEKKKKKKIALPSSYMVFPDLLTFSYSDFCYYSSNNDI